jgi:short-subunit dehydrogenase
LRTGTRRVGSNAYPSAMNAVADGGIEPIEHLVITGASNGIGRAIALALAATGRTLWLVGRDRDRLDAVARAVAERGAQAQVLQADLATEAGVDAVGTRISTATGRVDLVVHAAGVARADGDQGTQDFDAQFAVNVRAPMRLTRALLGPLEAAHGLVAVVNSLGALRTSTGYSTYAASKTAARAWADSLRVEVAGRGVRVCSIFPAQVATDMQERLCAERGGVYEPATMLQPSDIADLVNYAYARPTMEFSDLVVRAVAR